MWISTNTGDREPVNCPDLGNGKVLLRWSECLRCCYVIWEDTSGKDRSCVVCRLGTLRFYRKECLPWHAQVLVASIRARMARQATVNALEYEL